MVMNKGESITMIIEVVNGDSWWFVLITLIIPWIYDSDMAMNNGDYEWWLRMD